MARLKHKTVGRLIAVYMLWIALNRRPRADEVMHLLDCSRSCAYNYLGTLTYLFETMPE
jgi:hypothetical protein